MKVDESMVGQKVMHPTMVAPYAIIDRITDKMVWIQHIDGFYGQIFRTQFEEMKFEPYVPVKSRQEQISREFEIMSEIMVETRKVQDDLASSTIGSKESDELWKKNLMHLGSYVISQLSKLEKIKNNSGFKQYYK